MLPRIRFRDRDMSHFKNRTQHRLMNMLSHDNFTLRGLVSRLRDYYGNKTFCPALCYDLVRGFLSARGALPAV